MGNFRWLHFSDLHLKPEEKEFDTQMAWDALLDCVRKENFGNRDNIYVFITGDIFNQGKFEEEERKVQQISEFLDALGVQKEKVFWAAGNHDMKRTTGGEIIQNLRSGKESLDQLRKNQEKDENGYTRFQLLTRQRMFFYKKYYPLFFGIKLEEADLDRIHQTYVFDDFNLIVLNTSFTSFDDNDSRQIFLSSHELREAFESIDKAKPVFVIGHHGMDFWHPGDKKKVESLFDKYVDVYLCGHEHEPGISQFNNTKREIKQFTCGGGVFDGHSMFNFYFGGYDSSKHAIEIKPYVYQRTFEWKEDYNGISREFRKGKLYYFQRLIDLETCTLSKDSANRETVEKESVEEEFHDTWDLDCRVWRIPSDWDPDTEKEIPIDDRFSVPFPVQLVADRGKYAVFFAGNKEKDFLNMLSCQEEKYDKSNKTKRQKWEKRIWKEYRGNETWEEMAETEKTGILISWNAENISVQEIRAILRKWNEKKDRTALVFHIWADNPCNAVICAQRVAHILREIFLIPVLFKAVMQEINETEMVVAEIDRKIDLYNQGKFTREEEIEDLLKYRDRYPKNWSLLLKKHASRRKGKGWIYGYEAAYKVHEHARVWISAVDLNRFFEGGELTPCLFRLSKKKIDNLIWELFLMYMHYPTDVSNTLLSRLEKKASESMKMLMKVWTHRELDGLLKELDYEEISRWGRQASKKDYEYALSALKEDGIRKWVLMTSSIYGMENIMQILTEPAAQIEAQMILNQSIEFTEDVVLKEETDYIRYLIHNER